MTRRGRPIGFVSSAIADALRSRPRTLRELCADLQLTYSVADANVRRLRSAGHVQPVGEEPTGRRPATVFAAAPADAPAEQRGAELHFVMGMMVRGGRR